MPCRGTGREVAVGIQDWAAFLGLSLWGRARHADLLAQAGQGDVVGRGHRVGRRLLHWLRHRGVLQVEGAVVKPRAKLSMDDAAAIRRSTETGSALARRYGVDRSTISR